LFGSFPARTHLVQSANISSQSKPLGLAGFDVSRPFAVQTILRRIVAFAKMFKRRGDRAMDWVLMAKTGSSPKREPGAGSKLVSKRQSRLTTALLITQINARIKELLKRRKRPSFKG
jgi:hypothetical protein